MEKFVHVKNLNKYHPGYKDRNLLWCKIYFSMINADPAFEMINETDKWRFVTFIMLELQTKKPIPLGTPYLKRKGFNLKRPISLTLQVLHNFIEVVTVDKKACAKEVDKEVDKEVEINKKVVVDFFNYFCEKTQKKFALTSGRKKIIELRLQTYPLDQLKKAVDNFILDDWPDRHKFIDIVYCIGVRNKIDNLEKWLNYTNNKLPKSEMPV